MKNKDKKIYFANIYADISSEASDRLASLVSIPPVKASV